MFFFDDGDNALDRAGRSPGFQADEVADYERKRYRGLDQRLVNAREMRILKKLLSSCSPSSPSLSFELPLLNMEGGKREGDSWGGEGGSTVPAEPARALDAPCGYGRFANLLNAAGFTVFAADLSAAMVGRARTRAVFPTYPIGIVSNLTQGLPFKTGTFSLVFSMRFFHHLHESPSRRAVLAEFARVSREWLIVSYYQANRLHLVQRALRRKILQKKTRIKMIGGREFREEAESAGFEVARILPLFRGLHAQHIALLRKTGL